MNKIEKLRKELNNMSFPKSLMSMTNGEIKGNGFFPGANGLYGNLNNLNNTEIMILGQDQDTLKGFKKSVAKGNEEYTPTWRNLIKLLNWAEIDPKNCFFTNCILGVRIDSKTNIGKSPAIREYEYLKMSLDFLELQIKTQSPKAIICLGMIPTKLLGYLSQELLLKFIEIKSFKEIDENDIGLNLNIKFDRISKYKTTVIILTHPSYRKLNSKHRSYKGYIGDRAEIELLKMIK